MHDQNGYNIVSCFYIHYLSGPLQIVLITKRNLSVLVSSNRPNIQQTRIVLEEVISLVTPCPRMSILWRNKYVKMVGLTCFPLFITWSLFEHGFRWFDNVQQAHDAIAHNVVSTSMQRCSVAWTSCARWVASNSNVRKYFISRKRKWM